MATDKKISELPVATVPLSGAEKFEILQGGVNKQVDASDVATGGDVTTAQFRRTRVVTTSDAVVQADDNGLVIFNSASPINFTLDQLTADLGNNQTTRVSLLNVGAGAVTLVAGAGVTITGDTVLVGSFGTSYPSALVIYHTATTPRVVSGGAASSLDLETVDTTGATITLDFESEKERMFVGSSSFAGPKTIALANATNALAMNFKFNLTDVAAVLTFHTSFTMQTADSVRWNDGAHTFTPAATGVHEFSATFDGTDWHLTASGPYS